MVQELRYISDLKEFNTDDLYSMWTIVSKNKEKLEDEKRLENVSWKMWDHETNLKDKSITVDHTVTSKRQSKFYIPGDEEDESDSDDENDFEGYSQSSIIRSIGQYEDDDYEAVDEQNEVDEIAFMKEFQKRLPQTNRHGHSLLTSLLKSQGNGL